MESREREGDRGRAEGKWVDEKRKGRRRRRRRKSRGLLKSEKGREREKERERKMTEGEEGITQLHVGLMPGSSYGRAGREEGTAGKGAPMVGGKIEYESLMRAISALLPRPSATHSQTSRLSGCPSWPYLSLYRECAYNGGFEKGEDGRKHFESLMSRGNPQESPPACSALARRFPLDLICQSAMARHFR